MVIGILVFNKLVSKDGITDIKLKERAGYVLSICTQPNGYLDYILAFRSYLLIRAC